MAGWGGFLAVTAVVLAVLLVLARQSQNFIHEHADVGAANVSEADTETDDSEATRDDSEFVGQDSSEPAEPESYEASTPEGAETSVSASPEVSAPESPEVSAPESPEVSAPEDIEQPEEVTESDRGPKARVQEAHEGPPDEWNSGDVSPSSAGAGPDHPREEIELTPALLHANVVFTQILVTGIVLGAAWYFSIPAEAFGVVAGASTSVGLQAVAVGIGFGSLLWVLNEFSTAVADAVGAAYDETVRELLAPETTQGWVVLFVVVLPVIAFAEELLFRGALIGVPAAGFDVSPWLLAVFSSFAFALGHGAQGRVGIVVTGLLGFVLAAGYIATGSLLMVVVAHYVINALEFLVHEFLQVEDPLLLSRVVG